MGRIYAKHATMQLLLERNYATRVLHNFLIIISAMVVSISFSILYYFQLLILMYHHLYASTITLTM